MTDANPQLTTPRKEWLETRKRFIGGSDIGTIVGNNPYGCARALWYEKVGVPGAWEQKETPVMQRGHILEPVAAKVFKDKGLCGPLSLQKVAETPESVLDLAETAPFPWMGGTPDYLLCREDETPEGILEIKTAGKWSFSKAVRMGGHPQHIDQVLWYLMATDLVDGHLFYLWPDGWETFCVKVVLTEGHFARLKNASLDFWSAVQDGRQSWVAQGDAPESMDHAPESLRRLPSNDRRCKRCPWSTLCQIQGLEEEESGAQPIDMSGDSDWNSAATAYLQAQSDMDIAKSRLGDARTLLEEKMGEYTLAAGGGIRVSWKPSVRNTLNTSALKKAHPDLASEFTKQTPTRSFRVTETDN